MRPYQTVILVVLAAIVVVYFLTSKPQPDPRIDRFVDCYVQLAILHEMGDTSAQVYAQQRDSVLAIYGFDEQSFRALKAEYDKNPQKVVDIWIKIDDRLKALKETDEPTE
jgi:hypothetical protein